MENLTLETLPKAITLLSSEISEIKQLLLKQNGEEKSSVDKLMNVQETAELLNLSPATVYGMVSRRKIPYMKQTKRLYFSQREITDWLKTGHNNSIKIN
jgi:excisionase family DNA binding protein